MARGKDRKDALLGGVGLFSACSDKELRAIGRLMTEVEIDRDEVLVREGDSGREFFVIAQGKAKVTVGKRTLATLGPGDFFGEMALLDHGPRSATVTAQTPMRVFALHAREFGGLIDASPSVARKIMKGLAARLRSLEKTVTH